MRTLAVLAAVLVLVAMPFRVGGADVGGQAAGICASPTQKIHEESFVPIGGIEQWVTLKGERCANPVVLFLHGGPGNTLNPYADPIYGAWEKTFTLVQWDQRGAGKTYGRAAPPDESALTIERMTEDGVQLATYLTRHLVKKKIILTGGSWGSILGVHLVQSRPDLFHAYVGLAQIVNYRENQAASYAKVAALADAAGDQATMSALAAIGPPPWTNPRNSGVLRRATRVYEAKTITPAPPSWWVLAHDYDTPQFRESYSEGEDFSFLQFVGRNGDGMFSRVDLPRLGMDFKIPVFIVQGAEDLVATPDVAKRYFDGITAPQKEFVLVPRAGHDPNQATIDAAYQILSQRVRPLAQ